MIIKSRLLKKSLNKAHTVNVGTLQVSTSDYMASKHCFSFVTFLAENFGCNLFRIMAEIVSKLLLPAI